MPKSEIHPKWYPDAKVICNGEVVMTTGSTQPELHVDVGVEIIPSSLELKRFLIQKVELIGL